MFRVVAHKTGTLTIGVDDTDYNAFLYASKTCPTDDVEWALCANEVDGAGAEALSFPVTSGETYYVFVDGALPSDLDTSVLEGAFRVTFSIP